MVYISGLKYLLSVDDYEFIGLVHAMYDWENLRPVTGGVIFASSTD